MEDIGFLISVGGALLAAMAGGLIARLLRLPVLVGYLLAGVVVGPNTPGFFADAGVVRSLADLGVALLMFAIGVQFSLKELGAVRRTALLGGGIQIASTILLGVAVALLFDWSIYQGLFLGCALSLSSTAVMMRILEERGEVGTGHGAAMLGISIVQDLSLVVMVALLPAIATIASAGMAAAGEVGQAILRAGLFVGGTLVLAQRVVPILLERVARTGSHELFLLVVVCICLVAAGTAHVMGLSLALGAFLAGLVVSESEYSHEVLSQVRPLRDIFASLFFVSVGMLIDPAFLAAHWLVVAVVLAATVVGKGVLSMLAVFALGWHGRTALLAGVGLAQIGEFSFLLAVIGQEQGLVTAELSGIILSVALLSILISPFLFSLAGPLYDRLNAFPVLSRRLNRQTSEEWLFGSGCSDVRVVILGYGRVGRYVSDALRASDVPHVVVDYDAQAIARIQQVRVPYIYGDASSPTVLEQTTPHCAELAIVALPEASTTETAIRHLKRLAPELPVVARVHRGDEIPRMRTAGADAVIHAEFEAGTEMIRQGLGRLGVPAPEVEGYIRQVRQHRYR